jgi:hypothetical protein
MVKGDAYGPMVNNRSFELDNYEVSGNKARVDVFLVSRRGKSFGFRFGLSKQSGNECTGCWIRGLSFDRHLSVSHSSSSCAANVMDLVLAARADLVRRDTTILGHL